MGGILGFSQSELCANIGSNLVDSKCPVRLNHQFFSAKQFQHRFSLRAIISQALTQPFFIVVAADGQFTAADITGIRNRGTMVNQVVIESALAA